MPGYIYLIMMADGVYKVGRTAQTIGPTIKRLGAYPGDSRTVYVRWCEGDVADTEKRILGACRTVFGSHLRGYEYFVGDESRFIRIINEHLDEAPDAEKPKALNIFRRVNGVHTVLATANVSPTSDVHGHTWYQHAKTYQVFTTVQGQRVYLQDVIKGERGPWVHINSDPWDFREENLVKTTARTVKRSEATSTEVGVCFVASRSKGKAWKVTISGKLVGYFKTEEEAVAARRSRIVNPPPPPPETNPPSLVTDPR